MALNFPDSPTIGQQYTDTTSGFTYQWDGTVWKSFTGASASNIQIIDDISASFNGSNTIFALTSGGTAVYPVNAQQLQIVLGGVVQKPITDYYIAGSSVVFTTAPASGLSFSGVLLGTAISPVGIASAGSVYVKQAYTPTGVQTSFTFTYGYTSGYLEVYRNGAKLIVNDDYTATNGTTFDLNPPAQNGDNVEAFAFLPAQLYSVDGVLNSLLVTGNARVTGITTLGNTIVGGGTTQLVVNGDARVTGILTVGTSSITLDGANNRITVGTLNITQNGISGATPDIAARNITGTAATFTGNVTIGGTLTYEDVTNIDSIGIVTARAGIRVTGGTVVVGTAVTLSSGGANVVGVVTATSFSGSGANLTTLNADNISSGTVPTARLATGTANSGTYLRGDQTWAAISSGITVTDDTSTNATRYITFEDVTSGTSSAINVSSSKLTFNPSTGKLTVTGFTASNNAVLPVGNVAARDSTQGSIRYNSEYAVLEFYDGSSWYPLLLGGYVPSPNDTGIFGYESPSFSRTDMVYITISTTGNAINFGDFSTDSFQGGSGAVSSTSRGVFGAGYSPTAGVSVNTMEYVTIANRADSKDFGDLVTSRRRISAVSNSTRGVFCGGYVGGPAAYNNAMDYITIASLGNATSFGSSILSAEWRNGCASPTRGVWGGGYSSGTVYNVLDYITIASTGNSTDFGDLTVVRYATAALSSSTRGVWAGGAGQPGVATNVIDYITIASTGNATDFGDLTNNRRNLAGGASNATRGVFAGGYSPNGTVMDYITIASTGNAISFGTLITIMHSSNAVSSAHGGLQ